jgi:prolyl oligopeptidase
MSKMNYPPAPRGPAIDVFQSAKHGTVEVPNPYAWLEDQNSTEYHSFVQAQNETFDDYINHPSLSSSRENLQKTLSDLHALSSPISLPRRVGAWYYYRASGHGRTYPVTYRSKTLDFASPEIFHDEAAEGDAGAAMISSGFSKTGRYWAYWSSIRGSEVGYIRVRDTTSPTGERTEDTVRGVKFTGREAGIKWMGDGGFLYQYWPEEETGKGKKGPQLRYHKLGEEQERDKVVYEDPGNPGYTFWASVDGNGEWVFLMVLRAGRNNQLWGARVSETEGMDGDLKFNMQIEAGWGAEVKYVCFVSLLGGCGILADECVR